MHKTHIKSFTTLRMLMCMLIIIALPTEICARGITITPYHVVNNDRDINIRNEESKEEYGNSGFERSGMNEITDEKNISEFENTEDKYLIDKSLINDKVQINDFGNDASEVFDSDGVENDIDNPQVTNVGDHSNMEESSQNEGNPNKDNPNGIEEGNPNEGNPNGTEGNSPNEDNSNGNDVDGPNEDNLEDTEEDITTQDPEEQINNPLLGESAVIVKTFNELKDALSNDNGIDTIYLGEDIDMEVGGIPVDRNKTNLTISGINPEDPDGMIHTLSGVNSSAQHESIYIPERANLVSINIEDMHVKGRNPFGFVSMHISLVGITITYERVDYTGPQMTYNRRGRARYIDCDILIDNPYGGALPQELAEVTDVELEGRVTIQQFSTTNKVFWMDYAAGSLTIAPNSDIDIFVASYLFCFNPYFDIPFTIGKNAAFNFSGPTGLGYNSFGTFTVEEGAQCYLETRDRYDRSMLRLNGDLIIKEGAIFEAMVNDWAVATIAIMKGYSYIFTNPKRVIMSNTGSRAFGWSGMRGKLQIETQQLNYWETAGTGTIADSPMYSWRKQDNNTLTVNGIGAPDGNLMISINHNLEDVDNVAPLTPTTFNVLRGKVISAGVLHLTADVTHDTEAFISGMTEPEAEIKVSYILNGETVELFSMADESGYYRVDIDESLLTGTALNVTSNYRYLSTTKTIEMEGLLSFVSVPSILNFKISDLSNQIAKVGRADSGWKIVISDTRLHPTRWELSAKLEQPFHANSGNVPDINNGIVFVNKDGNSIPLQTDGDTLIYENNIQAPDGQTTITWDDDKGVLAEIQPGTAYKDVEYTTSIVWNLTDAP